MDENAKLKRLLSIILLLLGPRKYSSKEIIDRFEISERSFYRYIKLLKETGIIVEQTYGLYFIPKIEPELKEISELLHFSEEEAQLLYNAILAIDDHNNLRSALRKKLYSIYDFGRIPESIFHPERAKNIKKIIQAIKSKKQIKLIEYQSAHSQRTYSKIVEAFEITTNYQMIWAYDTEELKNKQFKVSRINDIQILEHNCKYEHQYFKSQNDVFRMTGPKKEECQLKLSLRAKNLLIEEYPLSEKHLIKESNKTYLFQDYIYSYYGAGRFCMSLLNEIEIIKPKGLKDFVKKNIEVFSIKNND
jgi:predicted DNA-binding transcriptional regulator YafY